jgi:O-antigen/teichoic acid export membrane protein
LSAATLITPNLRRRALSLGAAKAVETGTQVLLPMLLARTLDTATFGEYRLLWLALGTVMAVAPFYMPQSLYVFLPRSDAPGKRLYVHHVLLFLAIAGLACAAALAPWNPWLPAALKGLSAYDPLLPAIVALWVPAYLLEILPQVDERLRWQAGALVTVAVLRTALLALAALSGDMGLMLISLAALTAGRLLVLLWYVRSRHGLGGPWLEKRVLGDQLRHSVPIGLWATLFALRAQADQWMVAARFSLQSFAAFSVAALLAPLVMLCRQAVSDTFFPSMSRVQASGDIAGMVALNARANAMVGVLLCPLLAFAFAFAEDIITLVYTATYLEAAPVMRVYIIGMLGMTVELYTLVQLLRLGPYVLFTGSLMLAFSVALSWIGGGTLGLAGAAAGSVAAIYVDRVLLLTRISQRTGVPLSRLQEWGSLARLVAYSSVSGFLAWLVVHTWFVPFGSIVHLSVGGAVIAGLFALLWKAGALDMGAEPRIAKL